MRWKRWSWAVLALSCFAANSLLCRRALASGDIDPASFTSLRLLAGALVLSWLARTRTRGGSGGAWSLRGAAALGVYAVCFSFAYLELSAATGALVLFAAVQVTMLAGAVATGERPSAARLGGMLAALVGVGYLLAPGVEAPSFVGAGLMIVSGIAWGGYSLLGRARGRGDAIAATARDFTAASVPAIVLSAFRWDAATSSAEGATLAIASGALASGLGYAIWFKALRWLQPSAAAVVQLAVPVLAAAGGAAVLSEPLSGRLVLSGIVVLSGIALSLSAPSQTIRAGTSAEGRGRRPGESLPGARRPEARASTA